ncbi:mucin-2-like [Oreochromis niloticus]|uniref:mucin-2-like n=1 Tax=Oreochromis niloticus TaxID=8128 RepID=UPI000DF1FF6F|nr:mucin-2-like [Oreochromis niloticus]CAI5655371.1 unnamed protein product [Mustela putorius furo]
MRQRKQNQTHLHETTCAPLEEEFGWEPWLAPNYDERSFPGTRLALGGPRSCQGLPPLTPPASTDRKKRCCRRSEPQPREVPQLMPSEALTSINHPVGLLRCRTSDLSRLRPPKSSSGELTRARPAPRLICWRARGARPAPRLVSWGARAARPASSLVGARQATPTTVPSPAIFQATSWTPLPSRAAPRTACPSPPLPPARSAPRTAWPSPPLPSAWSAP